MTVVINVGALTCQERIDCLRVTKMAQTEEKQALIGSMDHDDWALILPPPDRRKIVQAMSTSGMPITDCLLEGYEPKSNHPSGGFFGPKAVGENFGALLRAHPVYVDPVSSLAGGYMVNFSSYRRICRSVWIRGGGESSSVSARAVRQTRRAPAASTMGWSR